LPIPQKKQAGVDGGGERYSVSWARGESGTKEYKMEAGGPVLPQGKKGNVFRGGGWKGGASGRVQLYKRICRVYVVCWGGGQAVKAMGVKKEVNKTAITDGCSRHIEMGPRIISP